MGYELNRLMNQYGVSSPTMSYAGAANPGAAPAKPTDPLAITVPAGSSSGLGGAVRQAVTGLNQEQDTKYQQDLKDYYALAEKYNTNLSNYQADQNQYGQYKTDYQNRMQNTPMYGQAQFQTGATYDSPVKKWDTVLQAPKYSGYVAPADMTKIEIPTTGTTSGATTGAATNATDNWWAGGGYDSSLIPENFNWQTYTSNYGDLRDAGIDTEEEARRHYANYGVNENRVLGNLAEQTALTNAGYARGGHVKTHFKVGGTNDLSGMTDLADKYDLQQDNMQFTGEMPEIGVLPVAGPGTMYAEAPTGVKTDAGPVVATPVAAAPKAALPFGGERLAGIQALLDSYGPKDSAYASDLTAARAAAKAETDAFQRMLTSAMSSPEDQQTSKAEMYFRLAAAFGAPTKTGQFAENLGMVGKELGEYAKNKRTAGQQKLALGLEAQKLKMASSKEDLNTLRALAGEEMKDKRAIATELIKDYIKSGEPQSAAGKQAIDEGFKAGSPEYQKRVAEIGNLNVEGKLAQINASLAGVSLAQANLALNQEKFANQKAQQAKLSPAEMKLKTETEDTIAQTSAALGTLKQAYSLNPNTFDTSMSDMAQRKALEVTNPKHPKVVATREQENLLERAALAQLKSTFPGAISNDERKALQDVQGLGAKSIEERGKIMKNAYSALQSVHARHTKRLKDINEGAYRETASPIDEGAK